MKKILLLIVILFLVPLILRAQDASAHPSAQSGEPFSSPAWIKIYSGYDFSLMGDVINGLKAWDSYVKTAGYQTSLSTDNSGFQYGGEAGLSLDDDNALSVSLDFISTQTESWSLAAGSTKSISPSLQSGSLNYYRTILKEEGNRTYLMAGAGYYHASVNYYDGSNPSNSSTGTFTGDILGGTLGIGEEVGIGKIFTLGIIAKGRLATFSQVTAPSVVDMGSTLTAGPYLLGITTEPSVVPGAIVSATSALLGKFVRYAVVDYSGFSGDLTLAFHF